MSAKKIIGNHYNLVISAFQILNQCVNSKVNLCSFAKYVSFHCS